MTASIHTQYPRALGEKDNRTRIELQWFITGEVEEEQNTAEIVSHLELIDGRAAAVPMLDHGLGKRRE